jgi:hypothetical protein
MPDPCGKEADVGRMAKRQEVNTIMTTDFIIGILHIRRFIL